MGSRSANKKKEKKKKKSAGAGRGKRIREQQEQWVMAATRSAKEKKEYGSGKGKEKRIEGERKRGIREISSKNNKTLKEEKLLFIFSYSLRASKQAERMWSKNSGKFLLSQVHSSIVIVALKKHHHQKSYKYVVATVKRTAHGLLGVLTFQ